MRYPPTASDIEGSRIADVLVELTKGRDIMATLIAIAPDNAQWKNDLAWFERQIGRLQGQAHAQ
jgi:hypothetical protein